MLMLGLVAEAIGLIVGSIVAAAALSLLARLLAARAHRGGWSPLLLLATLVLAVMAFGDSAFVRLTALFGLLGMGLLWLEWLERRRGLGQGTAPAPPLVQRGSRGE